MFDAERLLYLGLSVLAFGLCHYMALPYHGSWQWWVWQILATWAMQPIINAVRDLWTMARSRTC